MKIFLIIPTIVITIFSFTDIQGEELGQANCVTPPTGKKVTFWGHSRMAMLDMQEGG